MSENKEENKGEDRSGSNGKRKIVPAGKGNRLSGVLFNPKAYQILAHLFNNPDKEFSISEIKDAVDVSRPIISKLVNDLRDLGLVEKRKKGNLYLISLNENSPYYYPLKDILNLDSEPFEKAAEELIEELKDEELLAGIISVYLFGSVARGVPEIDSDIDLLFVHEDEFSEEDKNSIQNFLTSEEKRLKVNFSVTWYEKEELERDESRGIAFVERVKGEGEHLYGEELW